MEPENGIKCVHKHTFIIDLIEKCCRLHRFPFLHLQARGKMQNERNYQPNHIYNKQNKAQQITASVHNGGIEKIPSSKCTEIKADKKEKKPFEKRPNQVQLVRMYKFRLKGAS